MSRCQFFVPVVASCALAASAHATPIFDTATISGGVFNTASLTGPAGEDTHHGDLPIAGGFGGIALTNGANAALDPGATASANSSLSATFTSFTITANGNAGTDADDTEDAATAGFASAQALLEVEFTVPIGEHYQWGFTDGFAGGTHAAAYVTLMVGDAVLFDSSAAEFDWTDDTGIIGPGFYKFRADATAYTNLEDGFNGLFAGSSFAFDFFLRVPAPSTAALLTLAVAAGARRRR